MEDQMHPAAESLGGFLPLLVNPHRRLRAHVLDRLVPTAIGSCELERAI